MDLKLPAEPAEDQSLPSSMGRVRASLRRTWDAVADFLLPPVCVHCHQPLAGHDALCAGCWRGVRFIRAPLCDRLGIPLPYDSGTRTVSAAALADPPDYDRARAAAHFDGIVRDLVHALKYGDRHDGLRLLGRWIAAAGDEVLAEVDLVVPVPLHRWRLFHRRFNQAALLAQEVARLRRLPWDAGVLERVKRTPQQVGLSRDQRQRNMAAAFAVPAQAQSRVDGRAIVLVDDVITTGATVEACARALKSAGAVRVDVLAVAMAGRDPAS